MEKYFELSNEGIKWTVKQGGQHIDNIEMSAFYADYIVAYGTKEQGLLYLSRYCVYPMLRTIPNNTHASFQLEISPDKLPDILINGKEIEEYAVRFEINGILTAFSETKSGIELQHIFYPASKSKCNIERIVINNPTNAPVNIKIPQEHTTVHSYEKGTKGVYVVEVSHDAKEDMTLNPGEAYIFHIYYSARIANEPLIIPNGEEELKARKRRVSQLCTPLTLDTGDSVIDTMFRFAKIRAGESIFQTLTGLMHSPGGHNFYAATWCNDQIEYAGPWFAMTGDKYAIEATINACRHYIPFMSDLYLPIPSSVIAEGLDIWEGAGDRGDAAMYLYGVSMFALCLGNIDIAKELWAGIKWCAEYCERKKSPDGVIMSDSDELEGRFPAGEANLSTSSLCYGGLKLASILANTLGETELSKEYLKRAEALESAIEKHFGAMLHGFKTYRYFKGYDPLRSWICLPICMGINTRLDGTLDAMLSGYLWTEDGMLTSEITEENQSRTIWDRATLYGFRSMFFAGRGNEIWGAFKSYCEKRLLGDRVPYAIEAYPENNKKQLSGESALFCLIITEGILGMKTEGMNRFSFTPRLPLALKHLYLTNIHAFGSVFDIYIEENTYRVEALGKVISAGENGHRVTVSL